MNGGGTTQCFICLNLQHMCGISGTTAAVTKVHYLCDVSCCSAMDQERRQGRFERNDVRTLLKFHVLLGKRALECYKLLEEGFRPT